MATYRTLLVACGFTLGLGACTVEEVGEFDNPRGSGHEVEYKPCTKTLGYWKTHNIYAKQKKKQIPWPLWEDQIGCGQTWYQWMIQNPESGHHWLILAHQWAVAMLNQAQGAPVDEEVQNALWEGAALLNPCELADEDIEYAMEIKTTLDEFNNGLKSAPHCDTLEAE